ncbi:MAG: hypothetical protein OXC92_00945 [Flavobacteriaceae bacterium]|nr:hypothetical protein [Flavobacteriaceae bacterium]
MKPTDRIKLEQYRYDLLSKQIHVREFNRVEPEPKELSTKESQNKNNGK